ncbi:ABC transporter substrate-binding protein [Butyrivibrio sp. WCD3002]|uniref:ABC transporter substrate-binding protein n=1 Tax=Butyrivibrio sp. WCD3002 TaxID=1280676 RepID=UPI0003F690DA|nr:extracellular solute-binding protein [Butyrivibrio sp. WCD3002]
MKKFYLKRVLSVSLAAIMLVSAAGCGKKKEASSDASEATHNVKDYVYKENDINLGSDIDANSINYIGTFGDKIYAAGNYYGGNDVSTMVFMMNSDGTGIEKVSIAGGDYTSVNQVAVSPDGSIYTIESGYGGNILPGGETDGPVSLFGVEDSEGSGDSGEAEPTEASDAEAADDTDDTDDSADTPDTPDTPGEGDDEVIELDEGTFEDAGDGEMFFTDDSGMIGGSMAMGTEEYYLVKYSSDGTEVFREKINAEESEDSYFYITSFVATDKGVAISDSNGIHIYSSENGSFVKDVDCGEDFDSSNGNYFALYAKNDGGALATLNTETNMEFYTLDFDGAKLNHLEGSTIPAYEYNIAAGIGCDVLLANGEGVFSYNVGDAEPKMIMNYVDSDISIYGLYSFAAINEKDLYCLLPTDESYTLAVLNKVDPKEVKDKKTIVLGCNYIDYDVRSHVVKFNKENDEYRIVISDYSKYDTDDNYSGGSSRLNTDIVSGNIPDILVLDTDMPVDSYISKGLFLDMSDYFNKDEEISKNEYLDTVMEAFKTDGKMYKLIPSFYVETVMTAKEYVGDKTTWTIADLEKLIKDKNVNYKNVFGALGRDDLFEMALSLTGSQFIDWSTLTCSYNSDAFIHLLEFANEFPEELEDDEYFADTSSFWREGKALASRLSISSFSDINYEEKGVYGKDIVPIGFPSENGTGAAIFPNLQLTISSNSKVKDGCWEFVRYFLTDDYQKNIDTAWPVSMKRINELAEAAQKKPTYTDENGKEVEYDDTYYIGDSEIIIDPMTKDEVQELIDYLGSIDQVGNYNEEVNKIIKEEAAAYFSGQKSAAEVADIIQSRVQIYVNEIS